MQNQHQQKAGKGLITEKSKAFKKQRQLQGQNNKYGSKKSEKTNSNF
jgi:hypothetical protein